MRRHFGASEFANSIGSFYETGEVVTGVVRAQLSSPSGRCRQAAAGEAHDDPYGVHHMSILSRLFPIDAERLSSAADKKLSFLAVRCNKGLEIAGIVKAKFNRPHNGHEAKPDQCASKELHR